MSAQRGSGLICCHFSRRNSEGPRAGGGSRGPPQPVAAFLTAGRTEGRAGQSTAVLTHFIPGDVCRSPPRTSCHSQTPAGINPAGVCRSPKPCSRAHPGGGGYGHHRTAPGRLPARRSPSGCPGETRRAQVLLLPNSSPGAERMGSFPSWGGFSAGYIPTQSPQPPAITFGDAPLTPARS